MEPRKTSAAAILGELLATQAAIRVLIELHPDRATIAKAIADELEHGISSGLQSTAPDDLLSGIQRARAIMLPPEFGGI